MIFQLTVMTTEITCLILYTTGDLKVATLPKRDLFEHVRSELDCQYLERIPNPCRELQLYADDEGRLAGREPNPWSKVLKSWPMVY